MTRSARTESVARRTGWRRLVLTSGTNAIGLSTVLGIAAFTLQAVALPRPSAGQLTATETVRWLTRHDAVESTTLVGQRAVSRLCVNAAVGPLRGIKGHSQGSLLVTAHARFIDTRFAAFRIAHTLRHANRRLAAVQAELAGCPRALERRISQLLDFRAPVLEKQVVHRRIFLVGLAFRHSDGLAMLVRPRTFAPVAVRIGHRSWTYLAPAEKRDLASPSLQLPRSLRRVIAEDL